MRIAIISEVFLPKIDGVVNRTLNLVRQLPRHGDELLVVCPRAPGCKDSPARVVDVPSFPFPPYPEYRIGLPGEELVETIRSFAPDVIHYVNPFAFGFRCHDVLHQAGIEAPTVFSFHTLYGEFVKQYRVMRPLSALLWWLTREYHNRAHQNLTVSPIMRQELIERDFQRVELWPPAVDTERFHPGRRSVEMRARLTGGRPERPLLLTVSRLAPEKNVAFLADVLRAMPDVTLAIVGDGPGRADLERRFEGTDTRFIGYLAGDELATAYASADAFVYASETETMGNVVLEAMASGAAVIAPRAGGIPNLFTHQESGFLYEPRNLAEAVSFTTGVLRDSTLREQIGAAAREAVEGRNWVESIERVRGVYVQAIEQSLCPAPAPTWREPVSRAVMLGLVSIFRAISYLAGPKSPTPAAAAVFAPKEATEPSLV